MALSIGVPCESADGETRVALTPEVIKKYQKLGVDVRVERGAGLRAGFPDSLYEEAGAKLVEYKSAFGSNIVLKVARPKANEVLNLKPGSLLIALLDPSISADDGLFEKLAEMKINAIAMEKIPRISRAQSMDALSSQANIAGYRAVIEAARYYPRFFPMMMTSAGTAKPCKLAVLGAGVAGLQAIGTARRLGAQTFAYDIRPEAAEQIQSLGAKVIEVKVEEEGAGEGGYAKELSEEGKTKQQEQLNEKLSKFDVIISTAAIPGRKAPVLVTKKAIENMRPNSVVVDLAASTGGNCELTEAGKVIQKNGVTIVGTLNLPTLLPSDASQFYSKNLFHLVSLILESKAEGGGVSLDLEDEIIRDSLVTLNGEIRT